eukprot:TRINITY_DN75289_c0_g1_i1.p1 TRINITY_DN75289_c0_g1~~TRINITY_DN75289_c0_g1_i1.p1  ORF type:complete len:846 (+),score=119.86 TRINITY_DN75289_c0_g1_i1:41-2578(+)
MRCFVLPSRRAATRCCGISIRRASSQLGIREVLDCASGGQDISEQSQLPATSANGVLWFANIYPTKAFRFDFRQLLTHHNHETLIPSLLPDGVKILKMVPREREGGAFVYFRAPPAFVLQVLRNLAEKDGSRDLTKQQFMPKGTDDVLKQVCTGISQYLKQRNVTAFLNPIPVRAHRVEGTPYLEDLIDRYPTSQIKIKVEPADAKVTEEHIYERLRRYGQLVELQSMPDGVFYASFRHTLAAVAARNCLHRGPVYEGDVTKTKEHESGVHHPRLHMEYQPFIKKWLRETLASNARYVIPAFAMLMFATTYFVWDPLRNFCVYLRISSLYWLNLHTSQHEHSQLVFFRLRSVLHDVMSRWHDSYSQLAALAKRHGRQGSLFESFWLERAEEVGDVSDWLQQPAGRVMLLTGHRGNALDSMARKLLRGRALEINVGDMLSAGGAADDYLFMRGLCRALGYWPAQGMDRQLSAVLDLMVPGSSKQLSHDNEVLAAVQRVLFSATLAVAAWQSRSNHAGAGEIVPTILVTGFTSDNKDRRPGFFEALVKWAAYLSESKLARVVFVADSSFGEPAILANLQDRPERLSVIQLQDAEVSTVKRILNRHLGEGRGNSLTQAQLKAIGGNYGDISALVAQLEHGVSAQDAVRRLVESAEMTVRRLLLTGQPGAAWTRPQLWRAIRIISQSTGDEGVPYDVFLWSVFRGEEKALRSMAESSLISVGTRKAGAEQLRFRVVAGSPLFVEVFKRLTQNEGLAAVLDLEVAKEDVAREQKTLDSYEVELERIQEIIDSGPLHFWRSDAALDERRGQLLSLITEQHLKLEKYHKARRKAVAILAKHSQDFLDNQQKC